MTSSGGGLRNSRKGTGRRVRKSSRSRGSRTTSRIITTTTGSSSIPRIFSMKLMIIGVTLAGFAAFTPLSAQRPSGNQRGSRQDCTNSQRSGSVSDIILGRRSPSTVGCVDNRTNQQANGGGWYEVGNDGYGGTIYERQTRDRNGNIIVQRARRDA